MAKGGSIVGAPLAGRVLIIDDVITAGTSVRESVELIRAAGASPCGVVIALDRMERGQGELSAVQEVERDLRDAGGRGRDARRPDGLSSGNSPHLRAERSGGRCLSARNMVLRVPPRSLASSCWQSSGGVGARRVRAGRRDDLLLSR
jgi:hypothetical protein